jgi:hypothetical protein
MSFVNPLILAAGLAAIAIPIAIHLLMRRRRKPTPWAAMRFLAEAMRKRKRRLQLERLLLLAVRCLLVAAIALALGRPMVRSLAGDSPFGAAAVTLAIVIDDSIASGAPDGPETTALDRHQAMALELLESLSPERGDRAVLVPLSGPLAGEADLPEASAMAPTSDLGAIGRLVEGLTPTDAAADVQGGLALVSRARATAQERGEADRWVVAVLADGVAGVYPQRGGRTATGGEAAEGGALAVLASDPGLRAQGPASDVGLAALTPVRPVLVVGQGEAVAMAAPARVTVARSGLGAPFGLDSAASVGVRLRFVDDAGPGPWATATARLRPGERTGSVVLDAPITGRPRGLAYLEAQIDQAQIDPQRPDAAGVPGNDSAVAAVALRRQLTAAIIDAADEGVGGASRAALDPENPAAWLRAALAPEAIGEGDPLADIAAQRLDPSVVDPARLARVDVAFVLSPAQVRSSGWRALAAFARRGGLVAVFPEPASTLAPWGEAMAEAFGLPWTIGPEAANFEQPLGLARAPGDDPTGLLRLIEGELERLLAPVSVFRAMPLEAGEEASARLLSLSDGSPAALAARPGVPGLGEGTVDGGGAGEDRAGRGLVVVFAMPLAASWTDLPARPAIVPLVQELARAGVGLALGAGPSTAGARAEAPGGAVQLRPGWALGEGGSMAPVRVGEDGLAAQPLRQAGPWLAMDGAGRAIGIVGVTPAHAGAAREPVERPAVREALAAGMGVDLAGDDAVVWLDRPGGAIAGATTAGQAMAQSEPSLALGAILLAVALALAALEAVLARLFSHAQVAQEAGGGASSRREAA